MFTSCRTPWSGWNSTGLPYARAACRGQRAAAASVYIRRARGTASGTGRPVVLRAEVDAAAGCRAPRTRHCPARCPARRQGEPVAARRGRPERSIRASHGATVELPTRAAGADCASNWTRCESVGMSGIQRDDLTIRGIDDRRRGRCGGLLQHLRDSGSRQKPLFARRLELGPEGHERPLQPRRDRWWLARRACIQVVHDLQPQPARPRSRRTRPTSRCRRSCRPTPRPCSGW